MKTCSVTISEAALALVKAEAVKDDRSARSWLDRYLLSTLPLSTSTPTLDRLKTTSPPPHPQPTPTSPPDVVDKDADVFAEILAGLSN